MCQFCSEHGEGKKWYLQMKNYSDILLHKELSQEQKEISGVKTRSEWRNLVFEDFVKPAIGDLSVPQVDTTEEQEKTEIPEIQLNEDEIVSRRMLVRFGQVLPIEDIEKIIDMVDSITRLPCGCRYITTGKTDKRYCFGIGLDTAGILGQYPDAASSLEVLKKDEAKSLFRKYDEEGLVHSIWTDITPYVGSLCNCDRDCLNYDEYIVKGGYPWFFRAEYICEVDSDLCTGCKECMKQCQFGDMFYSSTLSKVFIDPTRCFGCGVCRIACPENAIKLIPRSRNPEASNLWLRNKRR